MSDHVAIDDHLDNPLGLSAVLVGSLPATLLTGSAEDSYTVEAVFTRRAKPAEILVINDTSLLSNLAESGYPNVRLEVSDRRLRIHHTSLEELRDGLAGVLAKLLADISVRVLREEHIAMLAAELNDEREVWRARTVLSMAESIDFSLPEDYEREPLISETQRGDAAQVRDWDDEGGKIAR